MADTDMEVSDGLLELRRRDLAAYDKLPKSLRRALDEANYKFVCEEFLHDLRSKRRTLKSLVAEVKRLSANETKRRDALKADGKIPS
jgi:Family of unknown function (DUF6525)